MTREEKEQYLTESIAELNNVKVTERLKDEVSKLSDIDLDRKVDFAFELEGK